MFIIGITGGTGAGKTSALRALETLGALMIDCDALYHELLSSNEDLKAEIAAGFDGVLQNGEIDRKRLGEIVFTAPSALVALNAITHKYVGEEIERRLSVWESLGGEVAAIDAIALIESGRRDRCDITVGVSAPREARISRITRRDGITRAQAEQRINAQKPDSFYRENCGHILENPYESPDEFEEICKEYFSQLIRGAKNA